MAKKTASQPTTSSSSRARGRGTSQREESAGASASPETAADMPTHVGGANDPDTAHGPTYDEIADAAYHRYLRRGGQDGADIDDWVEAERELRSRR